MAWTAPATQTTSTAITAALWNAQVTNNLAFLGATHDHSGDAGDGAYIAYLPSGAIGIFDGAACPAGWTRVSAWDNKFVRGAASYGGSGGASTHQHTVSALASHSHGVGNHSHASANSGTSPETTTYGDYHGVTVAAFYPHTHPIDNSSASNTDSSGQASPAPALESSIPASITVLFCKKN